MRKRLFTLFLILPLLLLLGIQGAAANSITLDRDELEAIFTDIQLSINPWPTKDLVVSNFHSSPSEVVLPLGHLEQEFINDSRATVLGRKTLSVIFKVNGEAKAKVKMAADLELFGDVVLLTRRLGRREIITPDDLSVVRRNITMFSHELVTTPEEAIGRITRTSLGAGTILLAQYLENQPLVQRGDVVTITAATESLQISAKGEARSQGAAGEIIQVKNLSSRRIITAKVVGHGLVEVDF